jgi:hypothetical protein
MNEQFKMELQALLARYPEVQSVTVKMVQTFEVTKDDPKITYTTGYMQVVPSFGGNGSVGSDPTAQALLAGLEEIKKKK